jgi:hypothetical protein
MPGVTVTSAQPPEDDTQGNDDKPAETVPLLLPLSLDPETRARICLHKVAEHERLLRTAQLHDSLIELRHTRKIRHKLLLNHHVQIAGQGQRASTRSRAVLQSVEDRITKFVERYRLAYRALLQLEPAGGWRETYLELEDDDNRGPGKERYEEHLGDGSYFRSWIWLPNPQHAIRRKAREKAGGSVVGESSVARGTGQDPVPDKAGGPESTTDSGTGEGLADDGDNADSGGEVETTTEEGGVETATQEEVDEVVRVEWTTSFARLERWSEEVELLQEEMRRVVAFLEWKSAAWLVKVDVRGEDMTFDIQSGLNAYARKQAAVYRNLATSFATLWYPTLKSYGLEHSWIAEHMEERGVPLPDMKTPAPRGRGIFKFKISDKFRISDEPNGTVPPVTLALPKSPMVVTTVGCNLVLEEASYSDDSGLESGSDSETDVDDDPDF